MVYMAGDNNLAVDMAYAMEQIKGVAGEGEGSPNLFVYYDGNSTAIPTLYCDFSDPKRPRYVRSFKVPNKLHDVPLRQNENAADFRSVLNFVDWCVNRVEVEQPDGEITYGRRAQKYALIFSGHSLGFQDIGLFRDETSGKTMKMNDLYMTLGRLVGNKKELHEVIEGIDLPDDVRERDTTVLLGQPLDLLGFDACVMGMLEVGYQFSSVAKTMISSEGSVPSAGWTYAKILGSLACDHATYDKCTFAERFVREFIKSQDSFTVGGVSVDMAAWDLSKLTEVTSAFDDLAVALLQCFSVPSSRIYRQMERVILQVHWKCQSYMYDQNVDLGDFCELLDRECSFVIEELGGGDDIEVLEYLRTTCRRVLAELRNAVILSGFSGGAYQYSNGISVFFPWSREGYEVSRKNYEGLFFIKDTGRAKNTTWTGFLKKYLTEVAVRRFEQPAENVAVGEKHRYYSGVKFDDHAFQTVAALNGKLAGERDSKLAGERDSKLAGERDSKLAGERDSKLAGERDSKLAGERDSKLAGERDSKLAGERDSKLAGERDSKLAGERDSKLAGERDSKLAGERDSKLAGERDSKLAGERDSKLAGERDSKLAGERDSKLAGDRGSKLAGGGGSSTFFDSLRMFKNIEGRWNISGFTKKAADEEEVSDKHAHSSSS